MTTRIALSLAVLIAAFFALDALWLQVGAPVLVARKFADLVEWLAFWR